MELLPQISEATRAKLKSYGFENQIYSHMKAPRWRTPHTSEFHLTTGFFTALAVAGYFIAKRYSAITSPFVTAIFGIPIMALHQTVVSDNVLITEAGRTLNPDNEIQKYPVLNAAYRKVIKEADEEIIALEETIRRKKELIS